MARIKPKFNEPKKSPLRIYEVKTSAGQEYYSEIYSADEVVLDQSGIYFRINGRIVGGVRGFTSFIEVVEEKPLE
jgi:hypothetical protein